jgi:hypothetical protein
VSELHKSDGLSPQELEQQSVELLPDREEMYFKPTVKNVNFGFNNATGLVNTSATQQQANLDDINLR